MMTQLYEGGYTLTLQDDDYTEAKDSRAIGVNIPPVGYVYQRHPRWKDYQKLVFVGVFSRSDENAEQYWDRNAFLGQWDFDYNTRRVRELSVIKSNPNYVDTEIEEFRQKMWEIRINGMWFMNNGTPTYLTGTYAFYLIWWKLDVGYPSFRVPDWEFFLFWQYCVDDENCIGLIETTKRRQGKTMRSGVIAYDYPSSHRESHTGIQSKTAKDAKDNVYWKGVINKIKKLPDFFVPKYDLEKGKYPKSGLFFTETNVKGKQSLEFVVSEIGELESSITHGAGDEVYYDGEKLHRYIGDEVGKSENIDVYKRHSVIYYCLISDEGNIIGKALYTTTVEDMDSGGAEFRLLWDSSNQANKDPETGLTNSGLYRYFQPAYKTLYIDKYGVPNEDRALRKIMARRKKLEQDGDYLLLASTIRKEPVNWKEMFYVDPNECQFNAIKLNYRLDALTWQDRRKLYHIGNLSWTEGFGSKVKFTYHPKGRWWVRKDHDPNDESLWNTLKKDGNGNFKPAGNRMAGIDPFSHTKTKNKKNSNAACYVGYTPNSADSKISDVPIVEYIERPATVTDLYHDMAKTIAWTGCEAAIESNKVGLINFLTEGEGSMFKFCVKMFDDAYGIPSSTKTKPHILAELEEFVEHDLDKCEFIRLISDLFTFNINDTEENDPSMAYAYYRIGCYSYKYKNKESKAVSLSDELIDINELIA